MPEWWLDLNSHWVNIWIQHFGLIKGRAGGAKPRVTSALHNYFCEQVLVQTSKRNISALSKELMWCIYWTAYCIWMYICVCIIFTEVAHENSARRTLVFRLPTILSTWELFLLTVWCQLVVTEAHERQSFCLEVWCPMPATWQCPNCRKSPTWPTSAWPGTFSLWRSFKLVRMQQL